MAKCVVLLSGGMDSATVLGIALSAGHECYALSFDYGQLHSAELDAARRLAAEVSEHRVIRIDMGQLGGSALTDSRILLPESGGEGIPATYVPARNTVFLSYSLGWAEVLEADAIYIGINAIDYSGYPDCRPEYVAAFQAMANLATKRGVEGQPIEVRAPLIGMSKQDIIEIGLRLGLDYGATVSCYRADSRGLACGACDACRLRKDGFEAAGVADPTRYFDE